MEEAYLIVDSSSASIRAGVVAISGELVSLSSRPIINEKDIFYPDALYFSPDDLMESLIYVCREAVKNAKNTTILAVSAASQREGIVLLRKDGESIIGLPNIDNRGLEYEGSVNEKHDCYLRAGRWVSTLFPAVKLIAVKERRPDIYSQICKFTSISDYIGYCMTGKLVYEASQACETMLFNIHKGEWDEVLCDRFGIPCDFLPEIANSASLLGEIRAEMCASIGLPVGTKFYVGGADTQMAVECCLPDDGDLVVVAGTTTPIVSLLKEYRADELERCWSNRHVRNGQFIIETNVGASGVNYDMVKDIFYPGCSYEDVEADLQKCDSDACLASVGSMCFEAGRVTPLGGFLINAPISARLRRSDFVRAVLRDYAYSFKQNYDNVVEIMGAGTKHFYGCGNGFAGTILPQMMADLIERDIVVVDGYSNATITGVHHMLYRTLTGREARRVSAKTVCSHGNIELAKGQVAWAKARELFNTFRVSDLSTR